MLDRPLPVLVRVLVVVVALVVLFVWRGWEGIGLALLGLIVAIFWERVVLKDDDPAPPGMRGSRSWHGRA